MTQFQSPKGMPDFYAQEKSTQNALFEVMSKTAKSFAFQEIDCPVIESFALLSAKSGEEIKSQIFMLEKKGTEELALRPEFTPGFARMFVAKQIELPKPVKWFTIGKAWRYEAPQKGRSREFFQLNAELYGSKSSDADAEIINLAITILKNFGLKDSDFVVQINNRKLLSSIISNSIENEKVQQAMRLIDKSAKITQAEFDLEAGKEGLNKKQITALKEITQLKGDPSKVIYDLEKMNLLPEGLEGLNEIKSLIKFLPKKGIIIDISLARGFAYYTGTVFEISDAQKKFRAICGGGRYDNLIEVFGGQKTPAVGFGMGDKTISLLLQDKGLLPKQDIAPDFFVANINETTLNFSKEIAAQLRIKYVVEIDLMQRKLAKQLDYANSIGAKKVIFVGEEELKTKILKIKDMRTGKEEKVKLTEL